MIYTCSEQQLSSTVGRRYQVCDPFWENVPKVAETTSEIQQKLGKDFQIFKT